MHGGSDDLMKLVEVHACMRMDSEGEEDAALSYHRLCSLDTMETVLSP